MTVSWSTWAGRTTSSRSGVSGSSPPRSRVCSPATPRWTGPWWVCPRNRAVAGWSGTSSRRARGHPRRTSFATSSRPGCRSTWSRPRSSRWTGSRRCPAARSTAGRCPRRRRCPPAPSRARRRNGCWPGSGARCWRSSGSGSTTTSSTWAAIPSSASRSPHWPGRDWDSCGPTGPCSTGRRSRSSRRRRHSRTSSWRFATSSRRTGSPCPSPSGGSGSCTRTHPARSTTSPKPCGCGAPWTSERCGRP